MESKESIEFSLVGLLQKYGPEKALVGVEPGQTVTDAIVSLGVNPDLVAIVMVNGRQKSKAYRLAAGDKVKLLPMVGGG